MLFFQLDKVVQTGCVFSLIWDPQCLNLGKKYLMKSTIIAIICPSWSWWKREFEKSLGNWSFEIISRWTWFSQHQQQHPPQQCPHHHQHHLQQQHQNRHLHYHQLGWYKGFSSDFYTKRRETCFPFQPSEVCREQQHILIFFLVLFCKTERKGSSTEVFFFFF